MIIPSSMTPMNQSRSDSRTAYLDGVIGRPNLHLATGQIVTRLLLDKDNQTFPSVATGANGLPRRAYGVEVGENKKPAELGD
jgi:choline dehydrogenase